MPMAPLPPDTPLSEKGWFSQNWGCLLVGLLLFLGGVLLLLPMTDHGPGERRSRCKNNLRQIGLALHNYYDVFGHLPPAIVADEKGTPIHSWRALILPFLSPEFRDPKNNYRLDEPWDGPNNRKLADYYARLFTCPDDHRVEGQKHMTSYLAVLGEETAWPLDRLLTFKDFPDGSSNSILVAEVANSGVHWMEPRDLHVIQMNPAVNPPKGMGISSDHKTGAHILLVDGAVRFISNDVPPATIRALLTIHGGETIGEY